MGHQRFIQDQFSSVTEEEHWTEAGPAAPAPEVPSGQSESDAVEEDWQSFQTEGLGRSLRTCRSRARSQLRGAE